MHIHDTYEMFVAMSLPYDMYIAINLFELDWTELMGITW